MNTFLKFKAFLKGRKFVGKDKFGNKYFTFMEDGKERREVESANSKDIYPDNLPVEWLSWLHQVRIDPPSEELSEMLDKERERRKNLEIK